MILRRFAEATEKAATSVVAEAPQAKKKGGLLSMFSKSDKPKVEKPKKKKWTPPPEVIEDYVLEDVSAKPSIVLFNGEKFTSQSNLVLREKQNIEAYVIKVLQDYFRTTNKGGLTPESSLKDHGLDSLDAIEIAMQLEEDLGYAISAENLSVFHKVKHFIHFIEQVEGFKTQYGKDPLP